MHMADALISPTVGGTLFAASGSIVAWSCRQVKNRLSDFRAPLMGVMAAFIFAAQMINFSIPGTGSSGHFGGGVLLAAVLGPHAALLTIVSVLTVQAVFFADGGLLALGCNIFNMGVIPCLIAYPLVFRRIAEKDSRPRLGIASFAAAIVALQLGAFAVVLETLASGITELPFAPFALLMQPIHLVVGVVEGAATFAVLSFLYRARPELIEAFERPVTRVSAKRVAVLFALLALAVGGLLSRFAARDPDGLEWAVMNTSREAAPSEFAEAGPHKVAASLQATSALMPDYDFKTAPERSSGSGSTDDIRSGTAAGTSTAGVVGGLISLLLTFFTVWLLRRRKPIEAP